VLPSSTLNDAIPVTKSATADASALSLTIVLKRHDEDGFDRLLADQQNPASPQFRRWLTPIEIAERFGPSGDAYRAVRSYFESQGFAVSETSANRLTMTLSGSRAEAERAFEIRINDYRASGKTFRANDREPSLPAAIATHVDAVIGLSDMARPQAMKQLHIALFSTVCLLTALWDPLKDIVFGAGSGSLPSQADLQRRYLKALVNCINSNGIAAGYGKLIAADPPPPAWQGVDGTGQRVGIVAFDRFVASDVADYLAFSQLPASILANVTRVPVNGGSASGADQDEVLLDIANVVSIAPAAQVVVYDAPGGVGSFQAIFNAMINGGVTIISNSWAYCENETSAADVQSIESVLKTAAAAGISVLSASGDRGSNCLNGSPNTAHVPASSPTLTAVGGTSLTLGPGQTWQSETWWDGSGDTPPAGQGGYGVSRFFPRPGYQAGVVGSAFRSIPDVAAHADPQRGMMICQAAKGGCPSGLLYGGTSSSAPIWAGMVALLNQSQGVNLGFLNPSFYSLANTDAFHSAASMGSDFAHVGLGSPNLARLHQRLTNQSTTGAVDPQVSEVRAGPQGNLSFVTTIDTPLPIFADGSTQAYVVVRLADGLGNLVSGKTVSLSASAGSTAIVTPASAVTSTNNGAAIFTVTNLTAQVATFTATDVTDGVVLADTAIVEFIVPPAATAGIAAFPTTVQNNGVATTTITVTLQDALGRPTPGKLIALSQGGGSSVLSGPTPPVTNASGQIQFTATNRIAEAVTYTAVDVTDGELPIPGSAVVTFSGQASVSCVGAITAAPGYAVTPFATGFVAENFFFSNVNWGGCPGGSDPTFAPGGSFYVSSFRTGELFKLPAQGGAASTGNRLSTPGLALTRTVFGKDGKLYAARSATGGGLFSGQILELDPSTGATLRTLASNLPCVTPPAVDPISGDLFFTGQCFGAGGDDARLLRLSNPGSATPVLSTYATLPGTPNGVATFAPDGTIFVAIRYTAPAPQPEVIRISGANQPQPPTITPTGINAVFWVNVGETLPNGAAKSLIVNTSDQKLKLADITTNPPALTELLTTGASSGTVGPDGCLYISNGATIFKLTTATGACGFATTAVVPAIALTPATQTVNPLQGSSVTLTATVLGVPPTAGLEITFGISGANAQLRAARTDSTGTATITYTGLLTGTDRISAAASLGQSLIGSNIARVTWTAGPHSSLLTVTGQEGAIVGVPTTLSAALVDVSVNPAVPVSGVTLSFNVAGQTCNAVTNASGVASCQVTIPLVGNYTLMVTFAGNGSFVASTQAQGFTVLAAGPPPCFAFNDVDSTSVFCANVEWIRNRAVTLGCAVGLYCPLDDVFRLNMAAFMNRLGTVLSPTVLFNALEPGAIDLDAQPVVCQTSDFATGVFTRRAVVDASFSGRSTAGIGFAADAVASFDGGATWIPLAAVGNRAYAGANQWGHVRARGVAELDPSQTVRFGLWISRGGQSGTADLTDSRCTLRAAIGSR
jgi:kumamolisin